MKITILTLGSRGDVQPPVVLGKALAERGHTVTVVSHLPFRPLVEQCGLRFAPLHIDIEQILRSATGQSLINAERNPLRLMSGWFRSIEPMIRSLFDDYWAACRDGADLIISGDLADLAGPSVAERLGVPEVGVTVFPWRMATGAFPHAMLPQRSLGPGLNRLSHRGFEGLLWTMLRPTINQMRRDVLGLAPATARLYEGRPMLFCCSPAVVERAADWGPQTAVTGYWFLEPQARWRPAAGLTDFLAAGAPPVCVTFGSITYQPERVTRDVVRALDGLGLRALLVRGWGGLSSADLPPTMHLVDEVPFGWLFPQVAAVVHHGGAGTTALALRAGVPQVITPIIGDEAFWASRMVRLGVSPAPLPIRRLSAEALAQRVQEAVSAPSYRQRAAALADTIRQEDGLGQAIGFLERRVGLRTEERSVGV
jgi:UDP:flavonoid glycosyltransferase YjiC (YdhE family)